MTPKEKNNTDVKAKIHQRHMLNSKDKKTLIKNLNDALTPEVVSGFLSKKVPVEWIKLENNEELYAIGGYLAFWLKGDQLIPLISFLLRQDLPFKRVKVDKGAIQFVAKGADIMRPGIIEIDPTIKKGDIIIINDPIQGKPLAIGEAMLNGPEMEAKTSGKVIKSLHSFTDSIFEFSKSF